MTKITKATSYEIIKPLEEDWKSLGKALNEIEYASWKISNKTVQMTWDFMNTVYSYKQRFGEKLKFSDMGTGKGQASDIYNMVKPEHINVSTGSISNIIRNAQSRFNNENKEVLLGQKSVPSFKRGTPFPVKAKQISLSSKGNETIITLPLLSREGKKNLNIPARYDLLVKAKGSSKIIFDRLVNGEYKLCDSQILKKKNKWYVNLTYQFEKENEPLNEDNIMGIDMGVVYPVYMAFNNSLNRYSIEGGEIDQFRRKVQARRNSMLKQGKYCGEGRRGHGRNTRIKPIEKLNSKVENFKKTTNHKYSKYVIDMALKHKCGTIQMEDLSGIADGEKKSTFLGSWTYYNLQTKIENKAKEHGIEVVKVKPDYTSQRCNKCGFISKESRKDQSTFHCVNCGLKTNADFNASKNIAVKGIEQVIKDQLKAQEQSVKNNMKYVAE